MATSQPFYRSVTSCGFFWRKLANRRVEVFLHLVEELSEAVELGLQLFVVFLQDVHAALQPALVLSQQLGLR